MMTMVGSYTGLKKELTIQCVAVLLRVALYSLSIVFSHFLTRIYIIIERLLAKIVLLAARTFIVKPAMN